MVHRILEDTLCNLRDKLLDLVEITRLKTSTGVVVVQSMVEEDLCQV